MRVVRPAAVVRRSGARGPLAFSFRPSVCSAQLSTVYCCSALDHRRVGHVNNIKKKNGPVRGQSVGPAACLWAGAAAQWAGGATVCGAGASFPQLRMGQKWWWAGKMCAASPQTVGGPDSWPAGDCSALRRGRTGECAVCRLQSVESAQERLHSRQLCELCSQSRAQRTEKS